MSKKLGYTWYPNDWRGSDRVLNLSLAERGLYRELIDLAYVEENKILYDAIAFSRRFGSSAKEIKSIISKLENIKNKNGEPLIVLSDNIISIPSCEPRMRIVERNRENGKAGGRPKRETQTEPKRNPNNNPDATQTERQREREREKEREDEEESEPVFSPPPDLSYDALRPKEFSNEENAQAMLDDPHVHQSCMKAGIMPAELKPKLEQFVAQRNVTQKLKATVTEFRQHFLNWMNKQKSNANNQTGLSTAQAVSAFEEKFKARRR